MRALKVLVIVMGALILISMGLLGWGFYSRLADRAPVTASQTPAPARTASRSDVFGEVRLDLPAGCTVEEILPAGERLYLRTGPAGLCERIVVIESASGRVLGSLLVRP